MTLPRSLEDSRAWFVALAVLLAAAAGASLALARPNAVWLGVTGLLLIPAGALVSGRPLRAAAVTATLAYVGALVWAYRSHFSPLFAYDGLTDAGPSWSAIVIAAGLGTVPALLLPLSADRPSSLVLWPLYLLGYVPTIVVPLFMKGYLNIVLPFDVALLISMVILILIVRLPAPRIEVPHLSLMTVTRLLAIASLLSTIYILVVFGVHPPPSLANVYRTRATFASETAGATSAGYIVPWAGDVINPTLMTIGIARRRIVLVLLGGFGQLLIYADTGYKNVLFAVALVPLVYLAVASASRWFGLATSLATTAILLLAVPAGSITGNWSVTLARRVFAAPGQFAYYYYEYFSVHQQDHLSHSFLRWFIHSSYAQPPPLVIGAAYFPSSQPDANGHMWADAFANFGFAGIVVFTIICGLMLWVADGLGRQRDARLAAPMLVIAGLSLASSAMFTSILTLGVGLTFVLMAVMPPISGRDALSPLNLPRQRSQDSVAVRATGSAPGP